MLTVPTFPRLTEYCQPWLMEPFAFVSMWEMLQRMNWAAHMAQPAQPLEANIERVAAPSGRTVALVPVLGTLMKQRSSMGGTSTIQLRRDIRQAAADPEVSAILLAIESPGGVVAGTSDLAEEVRQARRSKPVWAHVDDLGASAAYWVASQAEKVFANAPGALVGSIGTVMTVYDASGAAEREGVKAMVFATGPLKGAGTYGSAVTEEQARYFQSIVDGSQQEFDAAVRRGRKFSPEQLAAVKTGGVWKATEAQRLGLIDGVQPLGKTIQQLAAAAGQYDRRGPSATVPGGIPMLRDRSEGGT